MTARFTAWRRVLPVALVLLIGVVPASAGDAPQKPDAPASDATPPNPPAAGDAAAPSAATAGADQPDHIGRSILVVNDVDGQSGSAPAKRIVVNDDILFAEDITTGADAKTVLEFRDGSTFELGPDAVARINSFIFNPEESTSRKAVQVTQGVFRYVSGFVASDQEAKITTPAGTMGIRGSVVEGIVDPNVPAFVYVGEGNATFTNSAGSSDIAAGGAIAVPSNTTQPMAPSAMPDPVAVQAIGAIERRLPPRGAAQTRPAVDETWLKRAGTADLVPAATQREREAGLTARPRPTTAGRSSMAGELGMLIEGNRVGMFRGGQSARTPEQQVFLDSLAHTNPRAHEMMEHYRARSQAMHRASMAAGTALVIHGVGRAAPSVEVMRRVTAAAARANPDAAAAIDRHAREAYRGPDRGDLTRRPQQKRPEERRAGSQDRDQHVNSRPPREQQRDTGPRPPRRASRERGEKKKEEDRR